ncbi:MAG: hypothetical protein AAB262_03000, partial [Elusimicrobiota bacterium]
MTPYLDAAQRLLGSRAATLAVMAALGAFLLAGAIGGAPAEDAYSSWTFLAVLGALGAGLAIYLARRAPGAARGPRPLGRFLLHAGMLGVMAGGAATAGLEQEKHIEVIEGQSVPVISPGSRLRLDKFHAFYREGPWHKGEAARLSLSGEGPDRTALVLLNRPARFDGADILLGIHGFAPLLRVRDKAGKTLLHAFVSLRTEFGEKISYQREIGVPETKLDLKLEFSPSPSGPLPTAPRLRVQVAEDERDLGRAELSVGQSASLAGLRV